jgi:hypothetical protein
MPVNISSQGNGLYKNGTAIPNSSRPTILSNNKPKSNNLPKANNIKPKVNNVMKPNNIKPKVNNVPKNTPTTKKNNVKPYNPYPGYSTYGYGTPGYSSTYGYGNPGYSSYGYPGYSSYGYGYPGYSSYSSYGYGYPGYGYGSLFGYNPMYGYYGNSYSGLGLGLGLGLGSNYLYGNQYSTPVTVSVGQAGIAAGPSVIKQAPAVPSVAIGTSTPAPTQAPAQALAPAQAAAQASYGSAPAAAAATITPPPDYYAIMGVPRTSKTADITKSYTTIKAAMAKIPAKAGQNSGKELEDAYSTLSDATKRKAYDAQVDAWVKEHPPVPAKANAKPVGAGKKRRTRRRRV